MNNKSSENYAVIRQWGARCFMGHSFKFQKGSQHFTGVHNEALTVAAMCVSNEKRSPFAIHGCNTAPTPSGFAEIVGAEIDCKMQSNSR